MGKYAVAVARGVALLDARVPGWRARLNARRLDLSSCRDCVLGQLFGSSFEDGSRALGLWDKCHPHDESDYGFDLPWLGLNMTGVDAEAAAWGELEAEWRRHLDGPAPADADAPPAAAEVEVFEAACV